MEGLAILSEPLSHAETCTACHSFLDIQKQLVQLKSSTSQAAHNAALNPQVKALTGCRHEASCMQSRLAALVIGSCKPSRKERQVCAFGH